MNDLPLTLFLVDDDEALRRSLILLLFSQGLAVQAFASGEDFLGAVNLRQPGCVILDLRLGGMSGLSVFEQLLAAHSPLVTLFLSAHGDIPTALEAVLGAVNLRQPGCVILDLRLGGMSGLSVFEQLLAA
uniref:response regulator transcription factor n=1 Tax=Aquitalea magnusonii TaxID=332411 RepID=UPI00128EEFF7